MAKEHLTATEKSELATEIESAIRRHKLPFMSETVDIVQLLNPPVANNTVCFTTSAAHAAFTGFYLFLNNYPQTPATIRDLTQTLNPQSS